MATNLAMTKRTHRPPHPPRAASRLRTTYNPQPPSPNPRFPHPSLAAGAKKKTTARTHENRVFDPARPDPPLPDPQKRTHQRTRPTSPRSFAFHLSHRTPTPPSFTPQLSAPTRPMSEPRPLTSPLFSLPHLPTFPLLTSHFSLLSPHSSLFPSLSDSLKMPARNWPSHKEAIYGDAKTGNRRRPEGRNQ